MDFTRDFWRHNFNWIRSHCSVRLSPSTATYIHRLNNREHVLLIGHRPLLVQFLFTSTETKKLKIFLFSNKRHLNPKQICFTIFINCSLPFSQVPFDLFYLRSILKTRFIRNSVLWEIFLTQVVGPLANCQIIIANRAYSLNFALNT